MTKREWIAFEKLFWYAEEMMSDRGCNDVDGDILAMFTSEELSNMDLEYHKYNGDPEEHEEGCYPMMYNDSCMFILLFNKIKESLIIEGE